MTYERNELVTVRGLILVYETAKAIKVKFEGEDDDDGVWMPLSQVDSQSFTEVGEKGSVVIPFWLAEERGVDSGIDDDDGGHDDDDAPPL